MTYRVPRLLGHGRERTPDTGGAIGWRSNQFPTELFSPTIRRVRIDEPSSNVLRGGRAVPLFGRVHRGEPAIRRDRRDAGIAVALVLATAIVAFRDGAPWRAWAFSFALAAGFGVHLGGIGITGELPGIPFRLGWAIVVGVVTAVTLGSLGGVIGLGVRRLSLGPNGE